MNEGPATQTNINTDPADVKVFQIGRSRKIVSFLYLLCLAGIFIPLAGLVGRIILFEWESSLTLILFIPCITLTGFGMYWMIDELSGVLRIESDQIVYKSILKNRVLAFSDVKGYRTYFDTTKTFSRKPVIMIYPKDPTGKEIEVNKFIENHSTLHGWLSAHFTNLDAAELIQERKNIYENSLYGKNPEERKKYLALARRVALITNISGGVLGGLLMFLTFPPAVLVYAAIALVPMTFVLVPLFRGLLYFNNKTNSEHPYVGFGIIACCLGLLIRGIFDYTSYCSPVAYTGQSWIYVSLLALFLWGILLAVTSEFSMYTAMDKANMGAFLFFLFMYSFGTFFITNRVLDNDQDEKWITTIVTDKNEDGENYSIEIEPITQLTEAKLNVGEELFNTIDVGGTVTIHLKPGRWERSWFYVDTGKK